MVRAFYVDIEQTLYQDVTAKTPDGVLTSMPIFLDRIASRFDKEGTVILSSAAARMLKLPEHVITGSSSDPSDTTPTYRDNHGWEANGLYGWSTFSHKGRSTVHMSTTGWLRHSQCPLALPYPGDTVRLMHEWHTRTGSAWRGAPGAAGLAMLRRTVQRNMRSSWWLPDMPGPAECSTQWIGGAFEQVWSLPDWTGPRPAGEAGRWMHSYDARRAGLGAANTTEVCPGPLVYSEHLEFDPKRAGWWLVEIPAWNDKRLPHPAGPGDWQLKWLTTPTVQLLWQLSEEGRLPAFRIQASWTGPARRLYRTWAEKLDAICMDALSGQCIDRLGEAAKLVYAESHGRLNSAEASPWVFRPDHHHAQTAGKRAKIWRMADRIVLEGRTVFKIDDDTLWVPSPLADGEAAKPNCITLGKRLGEWQHKLSRERRMRNGQASARSAEKLTV